MNETDEYLYHYTNIESLALILKNKTIRFNSLDNMDDLEENMTTDVENAGQFTYVSCWTSWPKEKIALWKQYTEHDTGVRIALPKNPFRKYDVTFLIDELKKYKSIKLEYNLGERLFSIIDYEKMLKDNYFTNVITGDDILCPITYTENEDELIPSLVGYEGKMIHVFMNKVGKYKNEEWRYQKEWRYIIQFLPINFYKAIQDDFNGFRQIYIDIINGCAKQPFKYYDLGIDDGAFSKMKVTLSPTITAGNEELIRNYIENYNPEAEIKRSKFYGKIR